jgi:hypothetical protein
MFRSAAAIVYWREKMKDIQSSRKDSHVRIDMRTTDEYSGLLFWFGGESLHTLSDWP